MFQTTVSCVSSKKTLPINNKLTIAALDDFALKKRHRYGTVLINAETGKTVDMLQSRGKEDVSEWLKLYPDIKVFTRDGSSSYANAIKEAHPDALQIMDRFHILQHLTDCCKKFINRTVRALEPIECEHITANDIPVFETKYEKIMAVKELKKQGKTVSEIADEMFIAEMTVRKYIYMSKQEAKKYDKKTRLQKTEECAAAKEKLYNDIHRLYREGYTKTAIGKRLGTTTTTVSRYLKLNEPPHRAYNSQRRKNKLEPFISRINELGKQGMTNKNICKTIKAEGCTCCDNYILKNITEQRKQRFAPPVKKVQRKALISLLYKNLENIKGLDEESLYKIIERYPALAELYDHVRSFKELLFSKHYEKLDMWLDNAEKSEIPEIHSFVTGIRLDLEATKAAIRYDCSNGVAEGNVNKIKAIKRTMYGRCSFDLLRAKVLLFQLG